MATTSEDSHVRFVCLCRVVVVVVDFYSPMWVRDQTAFSSCLVSSAVSSVCSCCHDLHYSNDHLSVLGQLNETATNYSVQIDKCWKLQIWDSGHRLIYTFVER